MKWNAAGADFDPDVEAVAALIRARDLRFREALSRRQDLHFLYNRWVHLSGPLEPRSEAPFRALSEVCAERGCGFSAAITLGTAVEDVETLAALAQRLTRVDVVLAPSMTLSDAELLKAIESVARSKATLTLCGDIGHLRRIGAMRLLSLRSQPFTVAAAKFQAAI